MRRSRRSTELALLAVAFASGCSPEVKPDELPPDERGRKVVLLERKGDYEGLWQASMICAEIADEGTEHRDRDARQDYAKRGVKDAEAAIALKDAGVEGHYYRAINMGRLLEAERIPSVSLVSVMRDEAIRAAELDHCFECSGANRFLGILYSEAPEWGPGGVGDKDKARERFDLAIKYAPNCAENWLSYGKFMIDMEDFAKAREYRRNAQSLIEHDESLNPQERERAKKRCDELQQKIDKADPPKK